MLKSVHRYVELKRRKSDGREEMLKFRVRARFYLFVVLAYGSDFPKKHKSCYLLCCEVQLNSRG